MSRLFTLKAALLPLLVVLCAFFVACSDDDNEAEFYYDREISELTVLRQCPEGADSGAYCFMVRYRYPINTENLTSIYLWVDSTVVGDTAKTVSSGHLENATDVFEYPRGTSELYDTIDLTSYVQDFVKEHRDSLLVALYAAYSDNERNGTVQRIYLHFGDDIPPSLVAVYDSVWTTGALFEWTRPTDQTDFYKPIELSGPIVGYNVVIYSENKDEDLRNVRVTVRTPYGVDSKGGWYYTRHARIRANNDSVWIDSVTVPHGDNVKNYLRLAIKDGKGYNVDNPTANNFRLVLGGLKAESRYTIGFSAWDSSGNFSGTEANTAVSMNQLFITTDSIAPLMPKKLYTVKDSVYPEMARLDSNNRLIVYWERSVDPMQIDHGIEVDSVLHIPGNCLPRFCYDTVASYMVEYYDVNKSKWTAYTYAGGSGRYGMRYALSGDTMAVSSVGTFVADTIRWVAPGDTVILRIRSKDKSGYYSVALIDTIDVSPGALSKELECPEGFVAVSASDSLKFCMEKLEHQDASGEFMTGVLHSEALSTCESMSASGFKVSLCNERDWELVCLSGGTLSYGVVQEEISDAAEYLFVDCNVATNDSSMASDVAKRNPRCMNPMGVRDLPGQYQEWVRGRSEDTVAVLKGGSYKIMGGIDRESQALCTNRSFPYFTRLAYTTDSVFLYREGTKVDTVFKADTSRTLYKVLTQADFTDSLQFFDVQDSNGKSVGVDYAPYSEYKKGGDEWLEKIGNGMKYVPDHIEVVFLTGDRVAFRGAANFYRSPSIGFRCCAYKE